MIKSPNQKKHPLFAGLFSICCCLSLILLHSSCAVIRPSSYFRDLKRDTLLQVPPRLSDDLKIKTGDILAINVSSLNKEEDQLYNAEASGYEVSTEGTIHIHRLGKLQVSGLTRKQAKQKIEEGLSPYLKDPLVNVRFTNHFVTLMGDVGTPKVLPMPEESISIIDVLAQGGGLTQTILLSDVMVIRDSSNTHKHVKHLNLEDTSVFASNYFYLQPNDVVVLNSNEKAIMEEKRRTSNQQIISLTIQAVTIGLVIYQAFFKKQ